MEFVKKIHDTKVFIGYNQENNVGRHIKYSGGSRVLVNYSKNNPKVICLIDKIKRSLKAAGLDFFELASDSPNPRIENIFDGIKLCKTEHLDFVLSIGGLSEFATSKLVAAASLYDDNFYNLFHPDTEVKNALPVGIISTSVCGGNAFTSRATVSQRLDDKSLTFYSCMSEVLVPKFVICNAELTNYDEQPLETNISRLVTLLIYRYFESTFHSSLLSENLSLANLKTVLSLYEKIKECPLNLTYIENIMVSSIIANTGFAYDKMRNDPIVHIAKAVVSVFDCSLDKALALVTIGWLDFVMHKHAVSIAKLGKEVFMLDYEFYNPVISAKHTVNAIKDLYSKLGDPTTLNMLGGDASTIEKIIYKLGFPEKQHLDSTEALDQKECESLLALTME